MLLYFHKDPLGNFGDDLNPWLWPKVFPGLFTGEVYHEPKLRGSFDQESTLFVGIGTLINHNVPDRNKKLVFGAGVGYGDIPQIDDRWEFHFVRGPLTAMKLGLPASKAIMDPAVLAADYARPANSGSPSLSYMPHCASARHADWAALCEDIGIRFIDPHWPVDMVLDELQRTSALLTEALHGAILAEAFRIPWIAIKSSPSVLDFKWEDWCQSIGLTYEPQKIQTLWRSSGTVLGQLKLSLKKVLARNELRRISRNHRARLSKESIFNAARARLLEKVDDLRTATERTRNHVN